MSEQDDAAVEQPTPECQTEGCGRETEWVLTVGEGADGTLYEEDRIVRSYCGPCRSAAESADPWHPGDRTFRRVARDE